MAVSSRPLRSKRTPTCPNRPSSSAPYSLRHYITTSFSSTPCPRLLPSPRSLDQPLTPGSRPYLVQVRPLPSLFNSMDLNFRFILEEPHGGAPQKGQQRKRARLVTACDAWCASLYSTFDPCSALMWRPLGLQPYQEDQVYTHTQNPAVRGLPR